MTEVKPRRERKDHRVEPDVGLGGPDPMSAAAKKALMPLCGARPPIVAWPEMPCTRAQGHAEGNPGTRHVAAPRGVVTAIWEDQP